MLQQEFWNIKRQAWRFSDNYLHGQPLVTIQEFIDAKESEGDNNSQLAGNLYEKARTAIKQHHGYYTVFDLLGLWNDEKLKLYVF